MRRRSSIKNEDDNENSINGVINVVKKFQTINPPLSSPSSSKPKKFVENPKSRFGYFNGNLPKAKSSSTNLKHMAESNLHDLSNFTNNPLRKSVGSAHRYDTNSKSKNKKSKKSFISGMIVYTTLFMVIFLLSLSIRSDSNVSLRQAFSVAPDEVEQRHRKTPHDIKIKLKPESILETRNPNTSVQIERSPPTFTNLRASSSSNDSKNIHGGMAHKNFQNKNVDPKQHMRKSKYQDIVPIRADEYMSSILLNQPTDFLFATSYSASKIGGYGHLPFPIYCPVVSEPSNQAIEYIRSCENDHLAWSASLWVYPSSKDEREQRFSKKRIIFSNSVLELYLNCQFQLTLEYEFFLTESPFTKQKLYLTTETNITANEWSHVGVSMIPTMSNNQQYRNNDVYELQVRLFIEGKERASKELTVGSDKNYNSIDTTRIGQNAVNDEGFEGYLAMLAIWTKSSESAAFRDDFMMKSAHWAGLDVNDLMHLDQRGLVKSPNFLFPLLIPPMDEETTVFEQPIASLLKEKMQNYDGVFFRPNVLLHPRPFMPAGSDTYVKYLDGTNTPPVNTPIQQYQYDTLARLRRIHIRNAMKHVWRAYESYAYGYDELKPISKRGLDNWGGMCTTLVDSLDTLWLMGMKKEFWEGRDWIRDHLDFNKVTKPISVFETTIRNLGGLLSAYDLSGDKVFLEKAEDLGERMLKAFDSPSSLPYSETDLNGDESNNLNWLGTAILAEIGTLQLEFRFLGHATGKRKFTDKAMKAFNTLIQMKPSSGLYPIYVDNDLEQPEFTTKKISLGAMGDSFYEYLLKVWLQGGKKEMRYRKTYDKAIDAIVDLLVVKTSVSKMTYVAELGGRSIVKKMDHLACFLPGTLAVGAYTDPNGINSKRAQRDLRLAKSLAYTCYQMYARSNSGIAPEYMLFSSTDRDFKVPENGSFNILRPETAESLYVLHQLTGDNTYREWGWEIFQALEEFCKVEAGYGSLNDVNRPSEGVSDKMESFFMSETLKYLFMLQDPDSPIDILSKHVLNTEAHPLRMFDEIARTEKKGLFSFL